MMAATFPSVALIHSFLLSSELLNLVNFRATDRRKSTVLQVDLLLADFVGSEFWEACEAGWTAVLGWDKA